MSTTRRPGKATSFSRVMSRIRSMFDDTRSEVSAGVDARADVNDESNESAPRRRQSFLDRAYEERFQSGWAPRTH